MRTATRFALERMLALDRSIRAGEYPNSVTFAAGIEVDPRTVQRDIEFFRDRLGAPLVFDRDRNGYAYADPDYRLSFLELGENELIALFLAESIMKRFLGTPYAGYLASACRKIAVGISARTAGDLAAAYSFRVSAASTLDPTMARALAEAIRQRSCLELRYYSASSGEETDREVDPYHIANVDGDFYLVAFCHARQGIRMFSPARIRSARPTGATFEPPVDFDIEDYMAGSFAVLRGEGETHHVRLRFSGAAVRYVRERTWHPSQSIEDQLDGSLVLSLKLGHLREVERFSLSWGADCRVLGPESLRDLVAQGLALAASQYVRSS